MVILKVNEIQCNPSGVTMKTSREQLKGWMRSINQYYASLMYTTTAKDLDNNGKQHTYTLEDNKFVFEYYITGRIVVKTKNLQLLQQEFVANHEMILGVKLEMIGSLHHRSKSQSLIPVSKRAVHSASPRLQLNHQTNATTSKPSTAPASASPLKGEVNTSAKRTLPSVPSPSPLPSPPPPPAPSKVEEDRGGVSRDHVVAFRDHDGEINRLKKEVSNLQSEVVRLRAEMEEMQLRQLMDAKNVEEVMKKVHGLAIYLNGVVKMGVKKDDSEGDTGHGIESEVRAVNGESTEAQMVGGVRIVETDRSSYNIINDGVVAVGNGETDGGRGGAAGSLGSEISNEKTAADKRNIPKKVSVKCLAEHYQNLSTN